MAHSQHKTVGRRQADIDTTLARRIDVGPTLARYFLLAGDMASFGCPKNKMWGKIA